MKHLPRILIIVLIISNIFFIIELARINSRMRNYINYYNSTEILLDSLELDIDNPVFCTDYGADYLHNSYNLHTSEKLLNHEHR